MSKIATRGAHSRGQAYEPVEEKPGFVKCSVCRSVVDAREQIEHACHHVHRCGHPGACTECKGHGRHTPWCRYRLADVSIPRVRREHEENIARCIAAVGALETLLPRVRGVLLSRETPFTVVKTLCGSLEGAIAMAGLVLRDPTETVDDWRGPAPCHCSGDGVRFCIGAEQVGEDGADAPAPAIVPAEAAAQIDDTLPLFVTMLDETSA